MDRYPQMPKWCIRNVLPAFYDFESLTAIEQTGALYHTIRSLIDDYNNYVNEINKTFNDFMNGVSPQEEFESKIVKIVHDYIKMIDVEIQHQDRKIDESIIYIKNNMLESIVNIINEMKENGELDEVITNALGNINEEIEVLINRVSKLENEEITDLINRISKLENGEIEPLINRISKLENNYNIYIPSLDNATTSQSITLLKNDNTAILFDLGLESDSENNYNYLVEKLNNQKINYVVLSHYHGDHIGGLSRFSTLYADDVKFYLPYDVTHYLNDSVVDKSTILENQSNFINYLDNNNIDYIQVDRDLEIKIDELTLQFYNSTPDAFNHYKTLNITDYNTYSMNCLVKHDNIKILLPGDSLKPTHDYLLSRGQVEKVNILASFHHGYVKNSNPEYLFTLNPDVEFFTISQENIRKLKQTYYETGLKPTSTKYLSACYGEIEFGFDGNSYSINKGNYIKHNIWFFNDYEIYVDPTYKGISDGTINKPFVSIEEALNYIPDDHSKIIIHLASGEYADLRFVSLPYYLKLDGGTNDVTIQNITAFSCNGLRFSNLKMIEEEAFLFGSYYFDNVEFEGLGGNSDNSCIELNSCQAYFKSCSFSNGYNGIVALQNSLVESIDCSFNNLVLNINCVGSIVNMFNYTIVGSGAFKQSDGGRIYTVNQGTTANRPQFNNSITLRGYLYYDQNLGMPVFYRNTGGADAWINSTGEVV